MNRRIEVFVRGDWGTYANVLTTFDWPAVFSALGPSLCERITLVGVDKQRGYIYVYAGGRS